ncbi:MAG TPA: dihydroorotase [Planktothrix sp.]|jgi:dihydroorotase
MPANGKSTSKYLLKGGRVLNPSAITADELASDSDVRIAGGIVIDVRANLKAKDDEKEIDASGLWIMPGFIDLHTHLRDFNQCEKETVSTGTRSAAAGGYTTVVAMANTDPPMDNSLVIARLKDLIAKHACVTVLPVACVTKGMAGSELTNMAELAESGVIAFSDDGMPVSDLGVLRRALEYSEVCERFIISHPEDKSLTAGGVVNESASAVRLGLPGIPSSSEAACVAREIEVVRNFGGKLHFAHISTAAAVALIREAKASGLRVTADVTPHHLMLTDEDIDEFDTAFKMNPPLRAKADQEALVRALQDGTIDAIATDHAPHTMTEKARPFVEAPFGVIGLETAFPLALERLRTDDPLSHLEVISFFTANPAKILGLAEPRVAIGCPANLSLFDPKLKWTYDAAAGHSKSRNSPFNSRKLKGKTLITLYKGEVVYQDETNASGRMPKEQEEEEVTA